MRILIIIGGYFPGKKYGGPPVSVDNFCSLFKDELECYIVTTNHDMGEKLPYSGLKKGWNDRGNVCVLYLSDKEYGTKNFERVLIDINPDYLYLQGLFQSCVLPCLQLARKYRIKVLLAPRGELCVGAFKKKYKKIPYILYLRMMGLVKKVSFQSTSDEETIAIRKWLGVTPEKIFLLTNIPSVPYGLSQRNEKVAGVGRFVFISRILWKKNLLSAIKYLKEVKGNAVFDIYGPKEDETYWAECKRAINALPSNVKANYCGVLSHDDIHKTFNQYDAFLFPTLSENYGHVIAEALFTGCIPIISDQTPWSDMNEAGAGWAIPLGKEEEFKNSIQEIVDMDNEKIVAKRRNIEGYLNIKLRIEELKTSYLNVFK